MYPSNFIRIPLFKLHHISSIDDFSGLTEEEWSAAALEYSEEELVEIKKSIRWAVENEGFDFQSLLPNIKFSNHEIYVFFCKLNKTMPK